MLQLNRIASRRYLSTWVDKFDEYLIGAEPVKDQHSKLLAKSNIIYNVEGIVRCLKCITHEVHIVLWSVNYLFLYYHGRLNIVAGYNNIR